MSFAATPSLATGPEESPPAWYRIAQAEMAKGVQERAGPPSHPDILKYLATTSIYSNPLYRVDETPWCSAFVNWCLEQAGIKGTGSARARSWHEQRRGIAIAKPSVGCLVVQWRGNAAGRDGHVGFYAGTDGSIPMMLGGNQSGRGGDRISLQPVTRSQVLSYRVPG